jgi:hypothetical protein
MSGNDLALDLNLIYSVSDDVVTRNIEGDMIIIPLVTGIGSDHDELFSLNETGQAIWKKLDGQKSLREVINLLKEEYEGSHESMEDDVVGFVNELVKRKMVVVLDDYK